MQKLKRKLILKPMRSSLGNTVTVDVFFLTGSQDLKKKLEPLMDTNVH
jgi:hypothetical protein